MTTPACVEALVLALLDYTPHVIVGEADSGGYNPFSMDEVFRSTGLDEIARRTGARLVNLTNQPSRDLRFEERGRELAVPLPVLLLDEVDHVLTVPVPKVHANTGVSMSIKNQWGCIQAPSMRLRLHPYFARVIYEVNRALRVAGSVIDGRYGLNRNGPMRGDVERRSRRASIRPRSPDRASACSATGWTTPATSPSGRRGSPTWPTTRRSPRRCTACSISSARSSMSIRERRRGAARGAAATRS
jgi:hypothetical protein